MVFSSGLYTITWDKKTEECFSDNDLHFYPKKERPLSYPDLSSNDFGISPYLENMVSATNRQSFEALKVNL